MASARSPRHPWLAAGLLGIAACTDLETTLDAVFEQLEELQPGSPVDATPAVPADAPPTAPRLTALADQPFATHPFTVPWVHPPLEVTLFLPSASTRGPELAVGFERSLRGLVDRWPGAPCQPARAIDVYFVAPHLIEDRSRFDLGPNQPEGELWGVYSPWGGAQGVVAIILRDLDAPRVATVLGHELAHHWHHRMCMAGSSEEFAQAYESLDWPHAVHHGGPPTRVPPPLVSSPPSLRDTWEPTPPRARPLSKRERRRQRRAARKARRRR